MASDLSALQQAATPTHQSFLSRLTQRPKSSRKPVRPSGYASDSLMPPSPSPRTPTSFDSTSSRRASRTMPPQPIITIDGGNDDYATLFTRRDKSDDERHSPLGRSSLSHVQPGEPPRREKRKTIGYGHEHRPSHSSGKSSILPPPNQPPTVPLPAPPASPTDDVHYLSEPSVPRTVRQRAHTLSSISSRSSRTSPAVPPAFPAAPRRSRSIHAEKRHSISKENDTLDIDVDAASPEQLRHAVRSQSQRIEELAACIVHLTDTHATEKLTLERKLASMEREATRREKEIQGLTWLVNNGRSQSPISDTASKSTPTLELRTHDMFANTKPPSIKSPVLRRLHPDYGDDSTAAESSGNESASSVRTTRAKRASRLTLKSELAKRNSLRPHGPDLPLPEIPRLIERASSSSLASSAASSTSSLPTSTATLSAIPEGPPPVPRLPSRSVSSSRDPAIMAAIHSRRETDHKSAAKASALKASPHKAKPALTPAAVYAANLKKGRPASIAQLLDAPLPPLP